MRILVFVLLFAPLCSAAPAMLPPAMSQLKAIDGVSGPEFDQLISILTVQSAIFDKLAVRQSAAERVIINLDRKGNTQTYNSYHSQTKTLFMGLMQCEGRPRDVDVAVFLHEFAHSVFEPNYVTALALERMESVSYERDYIKALMRPDNSAAALPVDIVSLMLPFDEFFADAFAVLLLDDPQALSNFFARCLGEVGLRDFSGIYPVDGWNVGPLGGMFDRRHEVLNPARTYVWQKFVKDLRRRPDGKAVMLRALVDASVAMVRKLYQNRTSHGQWREIDQSKLNRDFIDEISQRLN